MVADHDKIDGALRARDAAPPGLTVLIGEEVKTADGDLICVFLERAIPPGLSAAETIAAAREQGALVGIPHPFDTFRGAISRDDGLLAVAPLVDWVETHNARLVGRGNEAAVRFAGEHGLPGVAVSDAHSTLEVGVAYTTLDGDPSTPDGLRAALASLPQHVRDVLVASEVDGESLGEIAAATGRNANAVAAQSYRAREALRQAYLAAHLQLVDSEQCRHAHELVPAYVRDTLAPGRQHELEEHLAGCQRCAADVEAARHLSARMPHLAGTRSRAAARG